MIWDDILPCGPLKQLIMVMFWFQAEIIYIEYISVECCWTKAIHTTTKNKGGYKKSLFELKS